MRKTVIALTCLLLALGVSLPAQSPAQSKDAPQPLGIWRGTLDGVPSVTLTLADDTGELGGTVVFYGLKGETMTIASIEPHTLVNPKLDGNALFFEIKMFRDKNVPRHNVKVEFTGPGTAKLQCLDCKGAPVADLTKDKI